MYSLQGKKKVSKEKYIGVFRATPIFVHPTKLSNHNLLCDQVLPTFFENFNIIVDVSSGKE